MAKLEARAPSISCIGVIGRENQPLHISVFPPYSDKGKEQDDSTNSPDSTINDARPTAAIVDFSLILNSSLDFFNLRSRDRSRVDQDLGLLYAVDERLSVWGWETPTGTKFVIVLDAWGQSGDSTGSAAASGGLAWGMKDGDLKPAFKALHIEYIRLLQNPFYMPDEHSPAALALGPVRSGMIKSTRFSREVRRIGTNWRPGVTAL